MLCLATIKAGILPWPIALVENFPLQCGVLLIVLSALIKLRATWPDSATFFIAGLLLMIKGLGWMHQHSKVEQGKPVCRILTANIWVKNHDGASLLALLHKTQPDVAALQEVGPACGEALREIANEYESVVDSAATILVRKTGAVRLLKQNPVSPSLPAGSLAQLEFRGKQFQLFAIHATPPLRTDNYRENRRELAAISEWTDRLQAPVIIAGDFNCTRSGSAFARMLHKGRLADLTAGFGFLPTWPYYPDRPWMSPFAAQIDHCMASREFGVVSARQLDYPPSNHRPLLLEVSLVDREAN